MGTPDLSTQLEQLVIGESVTIPGRGGWQMVITRNADGLDFTHCCPVPGAGVKFFEYTTCGNPYGAGMIRQEPTLGLPCRQCGVEADGQIVGAIVLDTSGKVAGRFSWSNLQYVRRLSFSIDHQGELRVNGASQGYLALLFLPDKNRMEGYVGVFVPVKPEAVKVVEMEELVLASLG